MRNWELDTVVGATDLAQHIEARLYNVKYADLTETQALNLKRASKYLLDAHLHLADIYEEETGGFWENGNNSSRALSLL
jgi:hypothetical protein